MRILFAMLIILLSATGCKNIFAKKVYGNGDIEARTYPLEDFNSVDAAGNMEMYISQGSTYSVKVETDGNLFEYLEIEKDRNRLVVKERKGYNLRPKSLPVKVYVTTPEFESAVLAGNGKIMSQTMLSNSHSISLNLSGSGLINVEVESPEVRAEIAGSGDIILKGAANKLIASIAGSGDIRAFELVAKDVMVDIAGSGDVETTVAGKLDVDVAGSGDVKYKGNPAVEHRKAGSGEVKKVG